MSIYTKTGDNGMTSLAGGSRVSKDDLRVEAYGTIDELNSFVGLLGGLTNDVQLEDIQRKLFRIGGYLAYEDATDSGISAEDITNLEARIDSLDSELTPLRCFILPGGCMASSICHVCRTVCRRAERRMTALRRIMEAEMDVNSFRYINRLSDFFFLLARRMNKEDGREDILL